MNVCGAVVVRDLCIGCGVCVGACPFGCIEMVWSSVGLLEPVEIKTCPPGCDRCLKVCPFLDGEDDESSLAKKLFAGVERIQQSAAVGYHLGAFVGAARRGYREIGASGGVASWFLAALIERNIVDAVIAVGATGDPNSLFSYQVLDCPEAVRKAAKSKYYPVEIGGAMREVLAREKRYAVVGLPCTIKGLRLAARADVRLRRRLVVMSGLVCGKTKSRSYTEYLARKAGADSKRLAFVDFRGKRAGHPASDYELRVRDEGNEQEHRLPWSAGSGRVWNSSMFTPRACLFCDDIFAETADAVFMDAWLPAYSIDSRGTSIVVVRSLLARDIVLRGLIDSEVELETLGIDQVEASQAGVIAEKRDALRKRLWMARQAGEAVPRKRVGPRRPWIVARARLRVQEAIRNESLTGWVAMGRDVSRLDAKIDSSWRRLLGLRRVERLFERGRRAAGKVLRDILRLGHAVGCGRAPALEAPGPGRTSSRRIETGVPSAGRGSRGEDRGSS